MPITNLFKNSGYYWGFAAYVAYYVNHPLYTAPSDTQVYAGLAGFLVKLLQSEAASTFKERVIALALSQRESNAC
jgi:hypothetical protein